jgi:hypothetical protein
MSEANAPRWDVTQLIITEYSHLRDEILKLVELQFQLVGLTVVSFGAIVSVGLDQENAAIILVHPVLALILSLSWYHHTFRIHRIAAYIRSRIERRVGSELMDWEHYVQRNPLPHGRPGYWGLRAAFAASSLLSVVAGLTVASWNASTIVMLVLGVTCSAATAVTTYRWREPAPELVGPVPPPPPASG